MHTKFIDTSPNKTERYHHFYMVDAMRRFEYDMHNAIAMNGRVPTSWHDLATKRDSETERVTLRLDKDVVKWFRSMGPKYQPRMNAVLRGFMHAKLMGLLQGDETLDMFRDPMHADMPKPQWGETERMVGDDLG
jgi:uncharacterized protein (DUF4415 family)